MSVDVGEGWRRLNDGERIEAGDEYEQYGWNPATKTTIGSRVAHYHCPYRRRVPAATADAPTPQPVAWGVWGRGAVCGTAVSREDAVCMQREFAFDTDIRPLYADPPALSQPTPEPVAWVATKPGGDGGYQRCIGWDREKVVSGIDQDASSHPISITPLYEHPPTPHSWCRDVARDLAARGSEDAAKVTLPEWRELPGIVADQVRTIANVLDVLGATCARVAALESAPKLAPAANADADRRPRLAAAMMPLAMAERDAVDHAADILEEMEDEDGNPLAPKAHTLRSLLIRKSNEERWTRELVKRRDEAIRERDEARARVRRLESEREDALLHLPACCGSIGHAAATLEAERDAAIRERDEARAECAALVTRVKALDENVSYFRADRDKQVARVAELEAASEAGTVVRKPLIAACWNPHSGLCDIGSGMGDMRYVRVSLTPAQVAEIERQVSGEVGR